MNISKEFQEMGIEKLYKKLDDLYISPFTKIRHYDENGRANYTPLERNQHPTGLYAADYLLQSLTNGENRLKSIADKLGCSDRDLSGFIRCLTGQPSHDFLVAYRLRLIDDLLRFTSLPLPDVARRSGLGTARSLHRFLLRHRGCTPSDRRQQIRKVGDEGRFEL